MSGKPLLIYGRPSCGLFSIVFQVLALARWAKKAQVTPIVYLGREVCFWEDAGYNGARNAWEYFFKPVSKLTLGDVGLSSTELETEPRLPEVQRKLSENVSARNDYLWDYIGAFGLPGRTSAKQLDRLVSAGKRYLRVRSVVRSKVDVFHDAHFGDKVVGVHYRGTDKAAEVPLVRWARYEQLLDAESRKSRFFVATDSEPFLASLRGRYGDRVFATEALRSSDSRAVHLNGGAKAAEQGLVDALLLSRCDKIIHGSSNLVGGAVIFNPSIKRVELLPE